MAPGDAASLAVRRFLGMRNTERAAYGRAALEDRASLSFIESKVRTMLTAITGQ